MGIKPLSIDLHIDHLTLDSVVGIDASRLRSGIQEELARLTTKRGVAPSRTGRGFAAADQDGSVAARIAQAVYRRIQE